MRRPAALLVLLASAAHAGETVAARAGAYTLTEGQARAVIAALPQGQRSRLVEDPSALAALLRDRLLSEEILARARAAGWDRRSDVRRLAEQAARQAVVESYVAAEVPPPPTPTAAEIDAAYQAAKAALLRPRTFHVAQIFLAVPAGATPAQVEAVRRQLLALRAAMEPSGATFAAAARRMSQDAQSAATGGDLGWLPADAIAEPVRSVVTGLPEASTSEPVRTADGWHLLRLLGTRPAGPAPLAEVRSQVVASLQAQARTRATQSWLDAMLQRTPVEIDTAMLRRLAAQAVP